MYIVHCNSMYNVHAYMVTCMYTCLHVLNWYRCRLSVSVQAKAQLEETYRLMLDEKDEKINVMQTQVMNPLNYY